MPYVIAKQVDQEQLQNGDYHVVYEAEIKPLLGERERQKFIEKPDQVTFIAQEQVDDASFGRLYKVTQLQRQGCAGMLRAL